MKYPKIAFVVAMEAEAFPIIKALNLRKDESFFPEMPMQAWIGEYRGVELSLILNGKDADTGLDLIGTQAATLATRFAIEKYNPNLIINAGTAGAFSKNGAQIGDIYLSRDFVIFHDRRIPIPGWDKQGIGYYPVLDVGLFASLGFKTGVITTGNSLDMPTVDEENIQQFGGEIKEMEAAAVGWIAKLHNVPLLCVKAVTDLVDSGVPTNEEFLHNIEVATFNLRNATVKIIDFLSD